MGKEIFIAYVGGQYEERVKGLVTHFGEEGCKCTICKGDRVDGKERREKRAKILDIDRRLLDTIIADSHAKRKVPILKKTIISIQQYIDSLASTYPPKQQFRPDMSKAYHALAEEYRLLGGEFIGKDYEATESAFKKANRAQLDSLIALGVKVLDDGSTARRGCMIDFSCSSMESVHFVQESGIAIAGTYDILGDKKKAAAWTQTVLRCEDLSSGGGKPFFRWLFMDQCRAFRFSDEMLALMS